MIKFKTRKPKPWIKFRKYRAQPWIKMLFSKKSIEVSITHKTIEWFFLLHAAPVVLFLISLFVGGSHLSFFLLGYLWDVLMFFTLTIGFYIFDVDWNDE